MSERAAEALANYWDALTTGRQAEPSAIDPALAEAVRRFHRADVLPAPDPGFVARLERELVRADGPGSAAPPVVARLNARASAAPRSMPLRRTWRVPLPLPSGSNPMRWAAHLATAALLLLTLAGGFFAIRGGIAPSPRVVPAGSARDATPDPATALGLLTQTTLDAVPSVPGYIGVDRWRLSPHSGQVVSGPSSGPSLFFVTEGRLDATLTGAGQVARGMASMRSDAVAPGVPIVLMAGDTLTVPANVGYAIANNQSTPAAMLAYYVLKATATDQQGATYDDRRIQDDMLASDNPGVTLPPGPMRIEMRRATLAPGASFPAPQPGVYQMVAGETKALAYLVRDADGRVTNKEAEPLGVIVVTMRPAAIDLTPGVKSAAPAG